MFNHQNHLDQLRIDRDRLSDQSLNDWFNYYRTDHGKNVHEQSVARAQSVVIDSYSDNTPRRHGSKPQRRSGVDYFTITLCAVFIIVWAGIVILI